ncbi:MAG: DNA primase [Chlorobi bacterium]|nr:DNA primase [Chlorobiota bacterium]
MNFSDRVEEVRNAADIVDVIGDYLRLQKRGKNYIALCPFHNEKTPSFNVSPERRIFKCFGCGKGGNVFTFLMEMEKISYKEAVRTLAERYGIRWEDHPRSPEQEQAKDALYAAMTFAVRFYRQVLAGEKGASARKYLRRRGWNDETTERFQIGVAPDAWDALLTGVRKNGLDESPFVAAGLLTEKDDGHKYDYFRNRLLFPIFSPSGRPVGFGGRVLGDDKERKYINTRDTGIYSKSNVVYGLYQAKDAIRKENQVVLVEGYADVLSLHQAGIRNVVAASGTALTTAQVKLLGRYTSQFLFVFDADSAGASAMLRGIELIMEAGYEVAIVALPQGEDPDSVVQKLGADEMLRLLRQSVHFVDFVAGKYQREGMLETPDGKAKAVHHTIELIARIPDPIRRDFYIKSLAEKFSIYESRLWDALNARLSKKTSRRTPAPVARGSDPGAEQSLESLLADLPAREKTFLQDVLSVKTDVASVILRHVRIDDLQHPLCRKILRHLIEQEEMTGAVDVEALMSMVPDTDAQALLTELLMPRHASSERWNDFRYVNVDDAERAAFESLKTILTDSIDRRLRRLQAKQREISGESEDFHKTLRLFQELITLKQRIQKATTLDQLPHVVNISPEGIPESIRNDAAELSDDIQATSG